ncbi:MAG: FG-GAP-like repeat-containing protein [Polyangiales bacterium]
MVHRLLALGVATLLACSAAPAGTDVPDTSPSGCSSDSDCAAGGVCAAGSCVAGCTATHPCAAAATCCDGLCADTATDPNNCGTCGSACSSSHVTATCAGGACTGTCDVGWLDCNADRRTDGCEVDGNSDPGSCGACGVVCSGQHLTGNACSSGLCVGRCSPGFADCDHSLATNGCETPTSADPENCGGCGVICSGSNIVTVSCADGSCNGACAPNWADCNGNKQTDGCETNIATSDGSCGACRAACSTENVAPTCLASMCTGACNPGFADCNRNLRTDGCEVDVGKDSANCGACGAACSSSNVVGGACSAGVCTGACATGSADCDGNLRLDGCETNIAGDPKNCGACDASCSTEHVPAPTCSGGTCDGTCATGWADCDRDELTNGCETDVDNGVASCGDCGLACSSSHVPTPTCSAGLCDGACAPGWADCNSNKLTDGCETDSADDWRNCGACGARCLHHCANGSCACNLGLSGAPWANSTIALTPGTIPTVFPGAVADVDGDGRLDLVGIINYPPSVSVFLNQGGGWWAPEVRYPTSNAPTRAAVGDLDGDGHADLAVTTSGSLDLLLSGSSSGPLTLKSYTSWSGREVAIVDVDRDGLNDLVVDARGVVFVLLNDGGGVFGAKSATGTDVRQLTAGTNSSGLVVTDFNDDGAPDIAVNDFEDHDVRVFLNRGGATFDSGTIYPVGSYPQAVVAADFDQDGHVDLATCNSGDYTVSVLLGKGDGTFASFVSSPSAGADFSIAAADLNGDHRPDLVVSGAFGAAVAVLWNSGAGKFALAPDNVTFALESDELCLGDLNGDGIADLVNQNLSQSIEVTLAHGTGFPFATIPRYPTGSGPSSLKIADLDGNGTLDVVTGNSDASSISVSLNEAGRTFAVNVDYPTQYQVAHIAVGDLNGDGHPDIVASEYLNFEAFLGSSSGAFGTGIRLPRDSNRDSSDAAIADVDGDGLNDIVALDYQTNPSYPAQIRILKNLGKMTFSVTVLPSTYATVGHLVAKDVNGDGAVDLILGSESLVIRLNDGKGNFGPEVTYAAGIVVDDIAVGDLDGDGFVDIALTDQTMVGGTTCSLTVLMNDGHGGFAKRLEYDAEKTVAGIAVGDVNGDGHPDVVVAESNSDNNAIGVYLNDGSGALSPRVVFSGGPAPTNVQIADMDADGRADVVTTNNPNGIGTHFAVLYGMCL